MNRFILACPKNHVEYYIIIKKVPRNIEHNLLLRKTNKIVNLFLLCEVVCSGKTSSKSPIIAETQRH